MTALEAFNTLMGFPLSIQLLLLSPTLALIWLWYMRPNLKNPDDHYYNTFTNKLVKDLRKAYWDQTSGTNVKAIRRNILENAWRSLSARTGPPTNWVNMKPIDRAMWAFLFTRIRDTDIQ